ncbi:MAG: calcium-binding protein [Hansschlegelia sp.]
MVFIDFDLDADDSSGDLSTGFQTAYTENAPGVAIADADAFLFNPLAVTSMSVAITGGFTPGDALALGGAYAVSSSYDGDTGVLTVSGGGFDYEELVKAVVFSSASDDPTAGGSAPTRTITTTVSYPRSAVSAVTTIAVTAIDDPAVARDDLLSFTADQVMSGSFFADNGSGADNDPDGPPLQFSSIPAFPAHIASGSVLINGSFSYVLDAAYLDRMPAPASGGANAVTTETLTYSLVNGGSATVTFQVSGVDGDDVVLGTDDPDRLNGGIGADTIDGFLGADTLKGGVGADLLRGGEDNDTYNVDDVGDVVQELAGQGYDIVVTSSRYALAADQEIEVLRVGSGVDASTGIRLTGNEFDNLLMGHAGKNVLDGGLGADTMQGGWGDDTYRVDDIGDIVSEGHGRGFDQVITSVDYALTPGQEIEVLQVGSGTPDADLMLVGNEYANRIIGNAGANLIDGGGGADTMEGGRGDDEYAVDNAGDVVSEVADRGTDAVLTSVSYTLGARQSIEYLTVAEQAYCADIDLTGNALSNAIIGGDGDNVLDGGGGIDLLAGGYGCDTFLFRGASATSDALIADFYQGEDVIALDHRGFAGLTAVGPDNFKDIATGTVDADDRILFDSSNGSLMFDADGSGSTAAVEFALIFSGSVCACDFRVV